MELMTKAELEEDLAVEKANLEHMLDMLAELRAHVDAQRSRVQQLEEDLKSAV